MSREDYTIRTAGVADIPYLESLMRKNREGIGFLPRMAVEERVSRGTVLMGVLNSDPCGYLLYDARNGRVRVHQACIQYDARRRKYGEGLVVRLREHYPEALVTLRCAADLEANIFWRDMGFICVGHAMGGARRNRPLNQWVIQGAPSLIPFSDIATPPVSIARIDCFDRESGFITRDVDGFRSLGALPKLAWSNRKGAQK